MELGDLLDGSGVPLIAEQLTGAAIDAARISTSTAQFLVFHDDSIPPAVQREIISRLDRGLQWLHAARELMDAGGATSLHMIRPPGCEVGSMIIKP